MEMSNPALYRGQAQRVHVQTRKHCAVEAAQKVENRNLKLRDYGRGLLEGDLPGAVSAEADAGAAVIVGKSFAVEGAGALQAVEDDGGVIAEQFDLNLGPSGLMKFVAGREDDAQNDGAVQDLPVGRDVNVFGGHEPVHGGGVVFKPRCVPGFTELLNFLVRGFRVHGSLPGGFAPYESSRPVHLLQMTAVQHLRFYMDFQGSSKAAGIGAAALDRKIGYLVLRFTLGLSIFMHGLTRLPHLVAFADNMVKEFANTVLQAMIVRPFALGLVFLETIVGLLVLVGLFTRAALVVGSATMAALIFGTALRSDWNIVAIQLLYCAIYAALIAACEYNDYSADALFRR
jgi:thiosulfate dehydrogenase [quinone] large subunit